jgi:hypothetical protein
MPASGWERMAREEIDGQGPQTAGCLAEVRVPENDPALLSQTVSIHGEGGRLFV